MLLLFNNQCRHIAYGVMGNKDKTHKIAAYHVSAISAKSFHSNMMCCACAMCIFSIICSFFWLILFIQILSHLSGWGCGDHESEGAASDGPIWQPGAAGSQHNNHSSQPPWS